MANRQALIQKIQMTLESAQRSFNTEDVTAYEDLNRQINELEAVSREAFQETLRNEYQYIIQKLENNDPLSQADREAIELLIIGEAKYYLRHENDFENWQTELKRLTSEIESLQNAALDSVDEIMHLNALCRDARQVVPDIAFYLQEKGRVERFKTNVQGGTLDATARQVLVDVIRSMMQSDKM